jgi:hypothetical protein
MKRNKKGVFMNLERNIFFNKEKKSISTEKKGGIL